MQHQISLDLLSHYVNVATLAGSSEKNGKELLLRVEIDHSGNVVTSFQVRTGTDEINGQSIELTTRLLPEAIGKYNSI